MTVARSPHSSQPIRRIGIIGGGQLAWMMGKPAHKLDLELIVQTPAMTDPAVEIASDTILAAIADATATTQLATRCDVITVENEFINLEALAPLVQRGTCFRPSLKTLAPLLDKYTQRCYLKNIGLPTPQFEPLGGMGEWANHYPKLLSTFPLVLKTRRHGYDGQGTVIVRDAVELKTALEKFGTQPLLVEEFVPFERELAIIAARSPDGTIATYPVVETQQQDQVCRRVFAPADVSREVEGWAVAIAHTLLNSLQAVGVFGIELFLTQDGNLLVNEIAPRTHNSGHFTIDACHTSQFEQHLRAVCGLPLGDPALHCAGAVMVNLLGYEHSQSDYSHQRQQLGSLPNTYVHWYGKAESRPGRKLGHVTALIYLGATLGLETPIRTIAAAIAQHIESIWYKNCPATGL